MFITGTLGSGGIERQITELSIHMQHNFGYKVLICCLVNRAGSFLSKVEEEGIEIGEEMVIERAKIDRVTSVFLAFSSMLVPNIN